MIPKPATETFSEWSHRDWVICLCLVLASAILFCSGLSIRSLWGSEGRWAVVAREMIQSGDLFVPTINGEIFFEKPLLSYWAIIPFYHILGMTEAAARMPGAIAGVLTVLIVFAVGRDFFGRSAALISAVLLMTSVMFVSWSRTASAEIFNVLGVWSILWAYLHGAHEGRFWRLVVFYALGAVACFCKGPVAFASAGVAVFAVSGVNVAFSLQGESFSWQCARKHVLNEYKWILSVRGLAAGLSGLLIFAALLLLPVFFSGSWDSVYQMWRENIVRFVKPFDHVDPPYAYLIHSLVFTLPWTVVLLACLTRPAGWVRETQKRWIAVTIITIFLFFTLSGSRRSYYILPLVPGLSLFAGKSIADWLQGEKNPHPALMKLAAMITAIILFLVGVAVIYIYLGVETFRHASEMVVGPAAIAGAAFSLWLIARNRLKIGLIVLFSLFFLGEFWGFTTGMGLAERSRTLKPFCLAAKQALSGVDDDAIALYGVTNSSLIYYLQHARPLHNLKGPDELTALSEKDEDGHFFLVAEASSVASIRGLLPEREVVTLLEQEAEGKKDDENSFVLLEVRGRDQNRTEGVEKDLSASETADEEDGR
ncbi:MAG TPA: glycosyltransferase family 39 protein [Syntrophorhabdaceae bacterium]|nr:glycosyltransferase family 39 protein [Syntrophorhabdaceae bacterium]